MTRARHTASGAGLGLALLAGLAGGGCDGGPASSGGAGATLAAAADSAEDFGGVAPFALVERSGRPVTGEDLRGRTWVCDFFFTTCTGPCPRMSGTLAALQERLADTEARLVSFSVDPQRDTPEVLRAYAERFRADPERWLFLTGEESAIHGIAQSFKLAVQRAPKEEAVLGMQVAHATKLVVVDREGRVRGYYDSDAPDSVERVEARVRYLERGPTPSPASAPRPRSRLPALNATLNGTAAVLLVLGLAAIKRGRRELHERLMLLALLVSTAFLASYLYYHFVVTAEIGPTRFAGSGAARTAYLALLGSHTILAVVNLPLVLRTVWLARAQRWEAHRRLARWTWPIWMYVSVTGVLVYLALYHWNPEAGASS